MNKWLQTFAYKIAIEWWTLLLSGLVAASMAVLTISIKSIKAALTNPVKSLKSE
jgi:putative ABC transport system permease protein